MKPKTIALNMNFSNTKFSNFRKNEYRKQWFVEFHGGTGDNFAGYIIKIKLESLEWFFNELSSVFRDENERFNHIAKSVRIMRDE